jgi:energy-coupling factor transport system permease protein
MMYRRQASPLHAARAACGMAYCAALVVAALVSSNPLVLGAIVATVAAAGVLASAGRQLGRAALLAVPLAGTITIINALVSRDGLTVILRLGDLPVLGHTDVTLESTVYGGVLGLRAVALILCAALYTAAIDPDEVLRLFRRISFRSALTATLATRMVPVLARDSRRLADAQRCRPGPAPSRLTLIRAATAGLLDRALDVAAALEVRGYGSASRPARVRLPWSRHDLAFLAAAGAVIVLTVISRSAGLASFRAYPSLSTGSVTSALAIGAGLLVCALLPFADRRGVA